MLGSNAQPAPESASDMRTETGLAEIQILTGNNRELLPSLPDESIQCCVTSPPYWGLRDYDHPGQIGAESSPDQYVSDLAEVFRQVRRVLKRGGTLWLNVGDGYARNGGTGNCGPNASLRPPKANS